MVEHPSDPSDAEDGQRATVAFLSHAETYGISGDVECHKTHGAIVFLAGDKAYKLKRAVRLPYLDYSTSERRHQMCLHELAVNRRMAPEIYLGVTPVSRLASGELLLGEASGAHAIDWLVVMNRFAQSALLENMRKSGTLTTGILRKTGRRVAHFHKEADPTPQSGGHAGIAAAEQGNHAILSRMIGKPFSGIDVARLHEASAAHLQSLRDVLEQRRAQGHVRRVHGDLHLNNICVLDGKPVPFDAIEFREDFAEIDTFYDLAFLLMDLDCHGLCRGANTVLNSYLETCRDYDGLVGLPLFLSCRAAIRAHVTMAMTGASDPASSEKRAIGFLKHALQYLEPPKPWLIATGGVSGTGKSTLARNLAPIIGATPGAVILRSDVIRKELWGVAETTALPAAAYTPSFSDSVFRTIATRAEAILRTGHSVIADAVYGQLGEREVLQSVAARTQTAFTGLWLEAPVETLEKRIENRKGDASDATVAVLHRQLETIVAPQTWAIIAADTDAEEMAAQALRVLSRKCQVNA